MAREVRIAGQEPDDWSESTRAEFADVDEASRRRLHLPSVIARHPTFLSPYMTWAKAIALHAPHRLPLRIRIRMGRARADRATRGRAEH